MDLTNLTNKDLVAEIIARHCIWGVGGRLESLREAERAKAELLRRLTPQPTGEVGELLDELSGNIDKRCSECLWSEYESGIDDYWCNRRMNHDFVTWRGYLKHKSREITVCENCKTTRKVWSTRRVRVWKCKHFTNETLEVLDKLRTAFASLRRDRERYHAMIEHQWYMMKWTEGYQVVGEHESDYPICDTPNAAIDAAIKTLKETNGGQSAYERRICMERCPEHYTQKELDLIIDQMAYFARNPGAYGTTQSKLEGSGNDNEILDGQ